MLTSARRVAAMLAAAAALPASLLMAGAATAATSPHRTAHAPPYQVRVILNGADLRHTFILRQEDGAHRGAVQPRRHHHARPAHIHRVPERRRPARPAQPTATPTARRRVRLSAASRRASGMFTGKCDGITADPHRACYRHGERGRALQHLHDQPRPPGPGQALPLQRALPHFGGTDAISIYHGMVLSARQRPAPPGGRAAADLPGRLPVHVPLRHALASVQPLFSDEAAAAVANIGPGLGETVRLALTHPLQRGSCPLQARGSPTTSC